MRDAVFAAMALHIFYRTSDVVKMAMQTQLCNLNESLFDVNGKDFVKTPTFFVMKLFKEHLENYVLESAFDADESIDALASVSEDGKRVTITATNKHLYDSASLRVSEELRDMKITMSDTVCADDVRSVNTPENPELIKDYPFSASLPEIVIPPHSVIRVVLEKK